MFLMMGGRNLKAHGIIKVKDKYHFFVGCQGMSQRIQRILMVCMIFSMNLLYFHFSGCPLGFYGLGCLQACACKNGASCDAVTGQCLCPLGYHGVHCEKGTGTPLMGKKKNQNQK